MPKQLTPSICLAPIWLAAAAGLVVACGGAPPAPSPPAPSASAKPTPPADAQKKTLPKERKVAPPADWETMYNPARGYSFEVPKGTTEEHNETQDGVDVYIGTTPKPSELTVLVVAFKEKKLTIDDLFKASESILKELGFLLSHSKEESLSDDYALAEGG